MPHERGLIPHESGWIPHESGWIPHEKGWTQHGMRFNIIFYIMPGGGGVEATVWKSKKTFFLGGVQSNIWEKTEK